MFLDLVRSKVFIAILIINPKDQGRMNMWVFFFKRMIIVAQSVLWEKVLREQKRNSLRPGYHRQVTFLVHTDCIFWWWLKRCVAVGYRYRKPLRRIDIWWPLVHFSFCCITLNSSIVSIDMCSLLSHHYQGSINFNAVNIRRTVGVYFLVFSGKMGWFWMR